MKGWIQSVLEAAPPGAPIVVVMRHAEREVIPDGLPGGEVPLNDAGRQAARELGRLLAPHLRSIRSSPVPRCLETAAGILNGAGLELECPADTLLGDPGVFVTDGQLAWESFKTLRYEELIAALLTPGYVLPGFAEGPRAVGWLLAHLFECAQGRSGLHLAITHDYLVVVAALSVLELDPHASLYADFLEPAAFWWEGEWVHVLYKGIQGRVRVGDQRVGDH